MKGKTLIALFGLLMLFTAGIASAQVQQAPGAVPPSAVVGGIAHITGTYYPAGTIPLTSVTVHFAATCNGKDLADTAPYALEKLIGSTRLAYFVVPSSLETGTYAVWTTGPAPEFTSITCSELKVTNTSVKLEACVPSSSIGVLPGKQVVTYVPNGAWSYGTPGIFVVPIEGGGSPTTIATPGTVNACSSNAVTGETVCTANDTDVYLITGSTLNKTLTSGANNTAGFSGGDCENCGVAINATTNTAYIEEGISGAPSGTGVQALNLTNNTFGTPFEMNYEVSENIQVDSTRNLVLTPGESDSYTLLSISPTGALSEYDNFISSDGEFDSAAEDCSTGIALASDEFTSNIYIQDLTQAAFTKGTPGTYTAPGQFVSVNPSAGSGYSAGTCGITAAPGSTHLAVVTGEFGGNSFAILKLPATSGSGTPNLVDYAYAYLPDAPDGSAFSAGYDPHTITAYVSPNNNKAYAVFADWATGSPAYVAVVDMAALLAAHRTSANYVDPSIDLVAAGIVTYFKTH